MTRRSSFKVFFQPQRERSRRNDIGKEEVNDYDYNIPTDFICSKCEYQKRLFNSPCRSFSKVGIGKIRFRDLQNSNLKRMTYYFSTHLRFKFLLGEVIANCSFSIANYSYFMAPLMVDLTSTKCVAGLKLMQTCHEKLHLKS